MGKKGEAQPSGVFHLQQVNVSEYKKGDNGTNNDD